MGSMRMSWEIARSLRRPFEAFTARHLLDDAGGTLSASRLDDARLIVSELVTNAVRHGTTGAPVGLVLRWDGQTLRVEVHSVGPFASPLPRAPLGPPNVNQTGGWGLRLVEALATRWGIEEQGETTVWAEVESEAGRPDGR